MESELSTVGQVAKQLGVPGWKVRRVVDSVGASVAKAGLYRLIAPAGVELIRAELQRQGWDTNGESAS